MNASTPHANYYTNALILSRKVVCTFTKSKSPGTRFQRAVGGCESAKSKFLTIHPRLRSINSIRPLR